MHSDYYSEMNWFVSNYKQSRLNKIINICTIEYTVGLTYKTFVFQLNEKRTIAPIRIALFLVNVTENSFMLMSRWDSKLIYNSRIVKKLHINYAIIECLEKKQQIFGLDFTYIKDDLYQLLNNFVQVCILTIFEKTDKNRFITKTRKISKKFISVIDKANTIIFKVQSL